MNERFKLLTCAEYSFFFYFLTNSSKWLFDLQVTNFCDSDADDPSYLHNSEAPTKQNKFCDGRSSWDVMREHPDFNGRIIQLNTTLFTKLNLIQS